MERALDLSRQGLASLAQVPRDVVRQAERDAEPYALSLAQNRLVELRDIHVFGHVVQLDLSGNQLQSLDGIDALVQLESLNAARNSLTSLDALASLSRLRVVNVAANKLAQLDAVRSLKTLVAVDASYNCVTKWPQFCQLAILESIDLSSNQLEAFPVSVAARLFPPSLRRLSLVKNQIQELCGVAALGMFLQNVETIKVDGNPATQRVLRDGGCLDFLWVNLFASVAFAKGAGVRRDDFVVPLEVVEAVEDAVERGDEPTLHQFLLTGTVAEPPPSLEQYRPQFSTPTRETPPPIAPADRRGYGEVPQQLISKPAAPSLLGVSDGLSKESKMEMWKRMMDERKAQDERDRAPVLVRDALPTVLTPPPPAPIPIPTLKPERNVRTPDTAPRRETAASSISVPSPSIDGLGSQLKTLSDQLTGMRKYINVWIKREQLTRDAAAKRIQKFLGRCQWRRHLGVLVAQSRARRRLEYGVVPCSSTRMAFVAPNQRHLHIYSTVIQRHIRGWLTRFRVSRWMYYSDAALRIQRTWRRRRSEWLAMKRELGLTTRSPKTTLASLMHAMTTLARDVRQLQRVFVVQEHVLAHQWRELATYKRYVEKAWTPAVVRIQSLWRGYVLRCQLGVPRHHVTMPRTKPSREDEIGALRQELDALKRVVQQLLEKQ